MRKYSAPAVRPIRAILLVLALAAAGCSSIAPKTTSTPPSASSFVEYSRDAYIRWKALHATLVGKWSRVTTCEEFVRAQIEAGFEEFVLEDVAGNGWLPGVTTPRQVAHRSRPCEGAIPRKHSLFFTEDGRFGSLDWNGNQVDDGRYQITDNRTFVIGRSTFHYQIQGDTIMFQPVIPDDCKSADCRQAASWSVAVAYPGKTWDRAD